MIDAVLSPHINPLTCGTAKWNVRLAEHLGVPCASVDAKDSFRHPLVSARMSELSPLSTPPERFDLLVHDWQTPEDFAIPMHWDRWVKGATRLFGANPTLTQQVSTYARRSAVELFCPSSLTGNPDRGQYRVLTYGMAHKFTAPYYEKLKGLLDYAHPNYTVSLSTAVHEGSPWDESLQAAAGCLREVFGAKLRVLGYLGDDGLAGELRSADVVALFYAPALRANNTTAWAALEAGAPLVTNLDAQSPSELSGRVMNIDALRTWPFAHVLKEYGVRGQKAAQQMSWEKLIGVLSAA